MKSQNMWNMVEKGLCGSNVLTNIAAFGMCAYAGYMHRADIPVWVTVGPYAKALGASTGTGALEGLVSGKIGGVAGKIQEPYNSP